MKKITFKFLPKFLIPVFLFFGWVFLARAATLFIAPNSGTYTAGSNFSVLIRVNADNEAINAAEGTLTFDPDQLLVTSVSKGDSLFTLWIQDPSFSNSLGTVDFSGIIYNPGYNGAAGDLLTVNFKNKGAGTAQLNFSSGSVLANDGKGTNVLSAMNGGNYIFKVAQNNPAPPTQTPAPAASTPPSDLPVVRSSTHPEGVWVSNSNPEFSWDLPANATGVSYMITAQPESNPGPVSDGTMDSAPFTDIQDGTWYFHLKYLIGGKWSPIAHYKFQIDTLPPPILEITRDIDQNDPANPQVVIVFKSSDDLSGVKYYQMKIGDGDWFEIDKSLEGQPYKLPMAQILDFHNVYIEATDLAGNSTITQFDVDLIEKISVKAPVKQGEPLEIKGIAKPNKKLVVSVSMADAAKQMLGAQISSSVEGSGGYTKEAETTSDENGNWQVEFSDSPPPKGILAISLQDYSVVYSKTPTETTTNKNWFQVIIEKILGLYDYFVKNMSQGTLFIGFVIVLVGLILLIIDRFHHHTLKYLVSIMSSRRKSGEEPRLSERNRTYKAMDKLIDDMEKEFLFLKNLEKRQELSSEEKYLKNKLAQYLKSLKSLDL